MNVQWVVLNLFVLGLVCASLLGCPRNGVEDNPEAGPPGTFAMSLGGAHSDQLVHGFETSDGGFFFTGLFRSTSAALGLYAIKTAADGYVQWWWPVHPVEGSLAGLSAFEPTPGKFRAIALNRQHVVIADIDPEGIEHVLTETDTAYDVSYERTFDRARALVLEDGFLLTLSRRGAYDEDAQLLRLGSDGTEQWRETVGYDGTEDIFPRVAVDAGGHITLVNTQLAERMYTMPIHNISTYSSISIRTFDDTGDVQDDHWIGDEEDGLWMMAFTPSPDGGLYVIGLNADHDSEVMRLNAERDVLWRKSFGGGTVEWLGYSSRRIYPDSAMILAANGDLVVAGPVVFNDLGALSDRVLLLRVDPDGNEIWRKVYGGNGNDYVHHILESSDGGFVLVGTTTSFLHGDDVQNGYVIKTDSQGNAPRIPQGFSFLAEHKKR